jgi:hypothetical protein
MTHAREVRRTPGPGRRFAAGPVLLLLAGTLAAPAAFARDRNVSISVDDDGQNVERCDQVRVQFGRTGRPLARSERSFRFDRSEAPVLEMHTEGSGGMTITGWDGSNYAVTACLAAGGRDDEGAARDLARIEVGFDDGRLSMNGPEDADWLVYFIVRVPDGASLDLRSQNEPIDLRDVTGRIRARTQNGPVSLQRCAGDIEVAAQNGPVSVSAGGGRQRLSVTNGPLSVALDGSRWEGEGIDADVENGPVSLTIPERYLSGVSLEMSGHAPLSCRAGCDGEWDGSGQARRLLFGGSTPVIRISSGNGPVHVDSGTPARRTRSI